MKKIKSNILLTVALNIFISCLLVSCKSEKVSPEYGNYPADVGKILVTKCAVSGCHNDVSKAAAGGLSLDSWSKLFEGGNGSACVIPYRYDFSTACYYINTYSDLGVKLTPTMPYNRTPLSHDDVLLIKNWVDVGAPDESGFVKFSDNPNRKKFYVTNQGCDVVTVFDAETLLPMRYINVGNSGAVESPHNIKISPDGKYWYVVSTGGNSLQKFRTENDAYVGEAIIGNKNWNTLTISNDGLKAYVVDWENNADIAEVNLNTFAVTHNNGFLGGPHGSCLNPAGDVLYVSQQNSSNKIYKIPLADFSAFTQVNLFNGTPPPIYLNSHEIIFSPDGSKYFVTCQGTSEVRVMKTSNDSLLETIPVGAFPSEVAVSAANNLLFVTCEEDSTIAGKRGSVAIIDIATNSLVSSIYTGHQPHGIALDDTKNIVIVANRNQTTGGPAPHHSTACGGKNGYVTFIDMATLTLIKNGNNDKRIEVSVDPYSIATRH